jgi:hypothetical protein
MAASEIGVEIACILIWKYQIVSKASFSYKHDETHVPNRMFLIPVLIVMLHVYCASMRM